MICQLTLCTQHVTFSLIKLNGSCSAGLKNDIDCFYAWSLQNNMSVHPSKTKLLSFCCDLDHFSLYLNGASIEPVIEVTDLGLTINCSLDWTPRLRIKNGQVLQSVSLYQTNDTF